MDHIVCENKIREVVAIFTNKKDLETAIDELICSGINPAYLTVLANEKSIKAKLGNTYRVEDLADDPAIPRADYIAEENIGAAQGGLISGLAYVTILTTASIVIASGGSTSSLLAAIALAGGTSSAIGSILARIIDKNHANYIEQQLAHGGLLLWVKIDDPESEIIANRILHKYDTRDIHVHEINIV